MKVIFYMIVTAFFLMPSMGYGEVKEIIAEGTYNMGDGETPAVAESRALLNAKRVAIEQAGTYIESYSKIKNFQLTHDEIEIFASGVMEVTLLEKKRTLVGDGLNFWVKIKTKISTDRIEEIFMKLKDKSFIEDYTRLQKEYKKSQNQIESLKSQLKGAKSERERNQYESKISDDEKLFIAMEWFEKGYKHDLNNEYDDSIEAYTKAISLYPKFAEAYNYRGLAYGKKDSLDRAIEDFDNAILIEAKYAYAYHCRGFALAKKGQFARAIEDFNKSISINPNNAEVYFNRGFTYVEMKQLESAMEDFHVSISLDPHNARTYIFRAEVYKRLGNHHQAIEDLTEAINLFSPIKGKEQTMMAYHAYAYSLRGGSYSEIGNYQQAILDFDKAIEFAPLSDVEIRGKNIIAANSHGNRGWAYFKLGNYNLALKDLNRSIMLDPSNGAVYFRRGILYGVNRNIRQMNIDMKEAARLGDKDAQKYIEEEKVRSRGCLFP